MYGLITPNEAFLSEANNHHLSGTSSLPGIVVGTAALALLNNLVRRSHSSFADENTETQRSPG